MALLVHRAYGESSSVNLATDLARYGPTAVWHGVYYRGEKIGFTVDQTTRVDDGFELREDGELQMTLFGSASPATIHTAARVDAGFVLRTFEFSLDPGTGAVSIHGRVIPPAPGGTYRLALAITSGGVTRNDTRDLPQAPVMSLNLSRMLAEGHLSAGATSRWTVIDPATLRLATVTVHVGSRTIVRADDTVIPAFRVDMDLQGLQTTSYITDTGEIVREESPLGLMTVRESRERAQGLAISGRVRADLLEASAIVPASRERIDNPRDVRRLRLRLTGADLAGFDLDGAGQTLQRQEVGLKRDDAVRLKPEEAVRLKPDTTIRTAPGATGIYDVEIVDARTLRAGRAETDVARYLQPEPLIESDAPEILAEAEKAVRGVTGTRAQAERLTRYVNALISKKPTISLPSALQVLHTKVGDCNEHTALYVAMARALGIPARIDVGLVYTRGAFYYHAWPEVYLDAGDGTGFWLPVDPTLNEFPADATHLRLLRGGLDRQSAILPLIGRLHIAVLHLQLAPDAERVLVGRQPADLTAADISALISDLPARESCRCATGGSR
jgi:transglutaminase-like putative cysteine protease